MICYGNYLKEKNSDDGSGMNVINVEKYFGKGNIEAIGARYTDRFLILDREDHDSDSEDKED